MARLRETVITLAVKIKLPQDCNCNGNDAREFVRAAILKHRNIPLSKPLSSVKEEDFTVSFLKKQVTDTYT